MKSELRNAIHNLQHWITMYRNDQDGSTPTSPVVVAAEHLLETLWTHLGEPA
jgi:hypothetical protein